MTRHVDRPVDKDKQDRARGAVGAASARDPLSAPDPLEAELSGAEDRIVLAEWSRRIPPVMARIPEVRIGKRWYSTAWLIPIVVVGLIVMIGVCQQLRTYSGVQSWIAQYPGAGNFAPAVTSGFPWWLRVMHFLNLLFM